MTNSSKLRELIKGKGFKLVFIAKELGVTPAGLAKKLNNESEFKPSEIYKLCQLLDIKSLQLKEELFFYPER